MLVVNNSSHDSSFFAQFLCISLPQNFVALLTYGGISHLFILNSHTQFWLVTLFLTWILLSIGPSTCLLLNFSFGGHTIIFIANEHTGAKTTPTSKSPMLSTTTKQTTTRIGWCLHQNLERRTRELGASKIVSSRDRSDVNQYQLVLMQCWNRLFYR